MPSASGRSTDSSTSSTTASSPTGRRSKARATRTGMRSSSTSTGGSKRSTDRGHPDRDGQFQYINRRVKAFQRQGQPVVSVDTKKKELVGQFRNGGREWQPQGQPEHVEVYDFAKKDLGKVIPYGIYDQTANTGWVSVGVDHDTAEFAVETLRRWWRKLGDKVYP